MYRTTIAMTSFERVTLPPVTRARGGVAGTTLVRLVFANEMDGYATVGSVSPSALYVTANGARTWRRVMHGKDLAINVTAAKDEIIVTSVSCKPRTMDCSQYTTRRMALDGTDWVTLPRLWRTGFANNDIAYGPSVAVYGDTIWELQTGRGIYLWTSHNNGRTFTRAATPELGSTAGCTFTVESSQSLWAECPTGMEISFLHSSDGGARWTTVPTHQFMGTGGGTFVPVSAEVAYLDYGALEKGPDLLRISKGGLVENSSQRCSV